jgi:hypothetical protein
MIGIKKVIEGGEEVIRFLDGIECRCDPSVGWI